MGSGASQWLFSAIEDALVGIGATAPRQEVESEARHILGTWDLNVGPYEGPRFLAKMFEKLDQLDGPASDSDLLRVVLALRVTQVPGVWGGSWGPGSNVELAAVADALERLGIPYASINRVTDLLRQLQEHRPAADDLDAQILADTDLSVLSTSPQG